MRSLLVRLVAVFGVLVTRGVALIPHAEAQYFGRNEVQYREFDFEVLKTTHSDVYFQRPLHLYWPASSKPAAIGRYIPSRMACLIRAWRGAVGYSSSA